MNNHAKSKRASGKRVDIVSSKTFMVARRNIRFHPMQIQKGFRGAGAGYASPEAAIMFFIENKFPSPIQPTKPPTRQLADTGVISLSRFSTGKSAST
jgi:hypothetical protein